MYHGGACTADEEAVARTTEGDDSFGLSLPCERKGFLGFSIAAAEWSRAHDQASPPRLSCAHVRRFHLFSNGPPTSLALRCCRPRSTTTSLAGALRCSWSRRRGSLRALLSAGCSSFRRCLLRAVACSGGGKGRRAHRSVRSTGRWVAWKRPGRSKEGGGGRAGTHQGSGSGDCVGRTIWIRPSVQHDHLWASSMRRVLVHSPARNTTTSPSSSSSTKPPLLSGLDRPCCSGREEGRGAPSSGGKPFRAFSCIEARWWPRGCGRGRGRTETRGTDCLGRSARTQEGGMACVQGSPTGGGVRANQSLAWRIAQSSGDAQ